MGKHACAPPLPFLCGTACHTHAPQPATLHACRGFIAFGGAGFTHLRSSTRALRIPPAGMGRDMGRTWVDASPHATLTLLYTPAASPASCVLFVANRPRAPCCARATFVRIWRWTTRGNNPYSRGIRHQGSISYYSSCYLLHLNTKQACACFAAAPLFAPPFASLSGRFMTRRLRTFQAGAYTHQFSFRHISVSSWRAAIKRAVF